MITYITRTLLIAVFLGVTVMAGYHAGGLTSKLYKWATKRNADWIAAIPFILLMAAMVAAISMKMGF